MQEKDSGRKEGTKPNGKIQLGSLHSRSLPGLNEKKIEKNGGKIVNEKVKNMIARAIKTADSVINRQGKVGEKPLFAI
jgi:hypothetical protein